MSELNEKIFNCIENVCISYDCKPIIGKQDAADEIEILVLQEKIDLLSSIGSLLERAYFFNHEDMGWDEDYEDLKIKISELTQQLNQLKQS